MVLFFSIFGVTLTVIEMSSYITLYRFIWKQDNSLSGRVLSEKVVNMRKKNNALSITGLSATWVMEITHLGFASFISFMVREQEFMRDVVGCVKYYDYYIIPLIQIHTSPPIRRYIAAKWGRTDPNDLSFFLHIVTFTVFRPRVYI